MLHQDLEAEAVSCPICGSPKKTERRFCNRKCLKEGYRRGLVQNPGLFKRGGVSLNKGRTLESWLGEERARDIKAGMSANSAGKAPQLRKLNDDPTIAAKRVKEVARLGSTVARQQTARGRLSGVHFV